MTERIYERTSDTLLKPKEEIIRCKDCKHFNDGDCTELPKIVSESDFCSFAERKELPSKEIINMKSVFNLSEDKVGVNKCR